MWKLARAAWSLRQARLFSATTPAPASSTSAGPIFSTIRGLINFVIGYRFPLTERDRLGLRGILPQEVLKAMRESDSPRPAIFAMSNPTKNAECTAVDAFKYAGENIIFASGSPFECSFRKWKVGYVNQANNVYLFPGIGLGALLSGAHLITDGMLQAAAECLASYITEEEIRKGILFPSISSIRHITTQVGAAVVHNAVAEELAEGHGNVDLKELMHMSKEES